MNGRLGLLQHGVYEIEIMLDSDATSPRSRDYDCNLGKIITWQGHPQANRRLGNIDYLGDSAEKMPFKEGLTFQEFMNWAWRSSAFIAPFYYEDRNSEKGVYVGGAVRGNNGWPKDRGLVGRQIGFVFALPADVRKMLGLNKTADVSKLDILQAVNKSFHEEVKTYAAWLRGESYGFVVRWEGEVIESCWGFVGELEYCQQEAKEAAERHSFEVRCVPVDWEGGEVAESVRRRGERQTRTVVVGAQA